MIKAKHFIANVQHPSWNAHSEEMRQLLGLAPKAKLPTEGMTAQTIQGIKVWVIPFVVRSRKSSKHRVRAECPSCGMEMSAGRLHQHICKS